MAASASLILAVLVVALVSLVVLRCQTPDIPRIGPKPALLGNTSQSYFQKHSRELLEEGYRKYKHGLYSLWTTDMDRLIVSARFMKDFMPLPRSTVRLTASIRHAGPYTGMNVAEESSLQFDVCAGQLAQNTGRLAQPVFDEIIYALEEKLSQTESIDGKSFSLPIFPLMIELVTSATARIFVGPELCRNPDWLSTATGYTMDVANVTSDLNAHYRMFHPVIAPFLKSCRRMKTRFSLARLLLLPLIDARKSIAVEKHQDMVQWLVDSARGPDAEADRLVRRMLFLNMAAIHTTAEVAAIALMELCSRPESLKVLREEMLDALKKDPHISLATLNGLKKTDSFIKEPHRLNPLGLLTFNRHIVAPVKLSNGFTIPANTYVSMDHYSRRLDPEFYHNPQEFDALRFYNLRQRKGEGDRHQFASISSKDPSWGVGKFACPGRHWASAQIKLLLMAILTRFDVAFPAGQREMPERVAAGEKLRTSAAQTFLLARKDF